jgi:LPXTG-motif cell wall-anchored protein
VTVVSDPPPTTGPPTELPATGFSSMAAVAFGTLLLLAGAGMVVGTRIRGRR